MSEQLNTEVEEQPEQLEQPEVEAQEVEDESPPAEASGTATDSEEDKPDLQKVIAEKAFEAREQKRRAEELEKRLKEIEASQPQPAEPTIPPVPDIYDDDFESKMRARDEAIAKHAEYRREQQLKQQQAQEQERQQQVEQQQALAKRAQDYTKRATALGVDAQELAQAGQRLAGHVSDDVVTFILDSDKGPLMTKYLAANPLEVDKLSQLNPMQAAVYLETQVKPKATQYGVKKPSQAPEPVETLSGRGASTEPGPAGATFE